MITVAFDCTISSWDKLNEILLEMPGIVKLLSILVSVEKFIELCLCLSNTNINQYKAMKIWLVTIPPCEIGEPATATTYKVFFLRYLQNYCES